MLIDEYICNEYPFGKNTSMNDDANGKLLLYQVLSLNRRSVHCSHEVCVAVVLVFDRCKNVVQF